MAKRGGIDQHLNGIAIQDFTISGYKIDSKQNNKRNKNLRPPLNMN